MNIKNLFSLIGSVLLSISISFAQQIGKFKLETASKIESIKKIDINVIENTKTIIKKYNEKNEKNFNDLDTLIKTLSSISINESKVYSALSDSLKGLKTVPDIIDTLSAQTANIKEEGTPLPCEKIAKISDLIAEKNDDAEYVFSFVDKDENPIGMFSLKEYNEPLFFDKVKETLQGICGDAVMTDEQKVFVDSLIKKIKEDKLFDKLLIASLSVKDDDVLSGKLSIHKHLTVEIKSDTIKGLKYKKQSLSFFEQKSEYKLQQFDVGYISTSSKRNFSKTGTYSFLRINTNEIINKNLDISPNEFSKIAFDLNNQLYNDTLNAGTVTIKNAVRTEIAAFTVHEIQIQFQDGFIENIKVLGKITGNDHLLKFENAYPIPFSTRRDFRKLYDTYVYERTIYATKNNNNSHIFSCGLRLGDLLFFNQNLDLNVKDYSPENQVYNKKLTQEITVENLYKERTSKILELKVYSDLKGIDNDNPNGLIQVELSKKLNFWNSRRRFLYNFGNIGLFNFITPYFGMNKIESNNKRVELSYFGTKQKDTMQANVYASSLKIFQHQTFSLGFNLTCFTIDIPGLKSILNLNTGLYFGRTLFEDTIRTKVDSSNFTPATSNNVLDFGLNTFQIVPEISLQVFPDKRFGVVFSQKFINFSLVSSSLKQVRDSSDYVNYIKTLKGDRSKIDGYTYKRWLASSEVFAFYQPSKYNKIFFRYRFNWDLDNAKTNFHQMQIGLLTFLSQTKKSKKEKDDNQ